jgi:Spy/CpxP family protein refolding chaperone
MFKRSPKVIILSTVAALAIPLAAMAGPGPGRGGPDGGGFGPGCMGPNFDRMFDHLSMVLDLSDEQEAQIEAIRTQTRAQIEPLTDQLQADRDAWRAQHDPGTFDEAAVRAFAASQSATHTEIAVIAARGMSQGWAVLTPEQQAQAQELMQRMKARRGSHKGMGHRGPRN